MCQGMLPLAHFCMPFRNINVFDLGIGYKDSGDAIIKKKEY